MGRYSSQIVSLFIQNKISWNFPGSLTGLTRTCKNFFALTFSNQMPQFDDKNSLLENEMSTE